MATETLNFPLNFHTTWSVAEFKRKFNVDKINVIRNPKTDLRFFQADNNSDIRGAIGTAWTPSDDTVISEVSPKEGAEAGVMFYLLHTKRESNNVLATL